MVIEKYNFKDLMLLFSLDSQHNETQYWSGWLPFRLDKMYFQVLSERGVQRDGVN